IAGGPDNADTILHAFAKLAAPSHSPLVGECARRADEGSLLINLHPTPFARFGLWHPTTGITDESSLRAIHLRPHGEPVEPREPAFGLDPMGAPDPATTSSSDMLRMRPTANYI